MAITQYEKDGKTLWKIYVNLRSRENPSIRVQKRVLDLKSESAAVAEEKRLIKHLSQELLKQEGRGLAWEDVIEQWELAAKKNGEEKYSELVLSDYVALLHRWTEGWLKRPITEITRYDVRDVFKQAEKDGRSANYRRKMKAVINHVFTWAIDERIVRGIEESPVTGIAIAREKEERLPEVLSLDQIRQLLLVAKRLEHPWYPFWATALLTGMRNGELTGFIASRLVSLVLVFQRFRIPSVNLENPRCARHGPVDTRLSLILLIVDLCCRGHGIFLF